MVSPVSTVDASRRTTRALLLDTAERLFAERGIAAVSLRSVGQHAGQRNNSVAQYHFGSRDGLIDAIIADRSDTVERRRAELVAELEPGHAPLRDVVGVFVRPLAWWLEQSPAPTFYLRFLAQVVDQDGVHTRPHLESDQPGLRWLQRELGERFPGASAVTSARRQRWMAQVSLRVLADHERELAGSGRRVAPLTEVVDDLLTMVVALFEAP